MNSKVGLALRLYLLSLVENMSPTSTSVEQCSSLFQESLLAVTVTENTCKRRGKCITLLARTPI